MRFAVVGTGSVGSFAGGSLLRAGHSVVFFGRGAHVAAIAERGLAVRSARGSFDVRAEVVVTFAQMRGVDAILLTVKAHQIAPLAAELGALAGAGKTIVTMQNGLPFWYFDGFGGALAGAHLRSVDPGGRIGAAIDARAVVACVVDAGTRIPHAGTVEHVGSASYTFGEPSGASTSRVAALVAAFTSAQLEARADAHIRTAVWEKLAANAAVNPVSALTRANAEEMAGDPGIVATLEAAMGEGLRVGRAVGVDVRADPVARVAANRAFGDQRTSMLQDLDAHRPLEVEPIVGAVLEVAGIAGVATPVMRRLYALTKLLDGTNRRGREE